MNISKICSSNNIHTNTNQKISFKANKTKEMFDEYSPKKLPEGKAIQIVKKPGIGGIILNTLSACSVMIGGFGLFGKITRPDLKLVDIDPNNLTEKQQKLIKRGKLINYIPRGYHIEGDKVKKNK